MNHQQNPSERSLRARIIEAIDTFTLVLLVGGALFFVGSVFVFIVQLVRYAVMPRL